MHTEIRTQVHLNFFLSSLLTSIFSILLSLLVLERCHNKDDLLEQKSVLNVDIEYNVFRTIYSFWSLFIISVVAFSQLRVTLKHEQRTFT